MREDMKKRHEKGDGRMNSYVEKLSRDTSDKGVEISTPNPLQPNSLSTPDLPATIGAEVGDLSTQEDESQAASGVETFMEVFMVSALTGDGVPDLRVMF